MGQMENGRNANILAFVCDREMWFSRLPPRYLFGSYCHEVGHLVGDNESFKLGHVLTPDEVKTHILPINSPCSTKLRKMFFQDNPAEIDQIATTISLANKILEIYTHFRFDPTSIKINTNIPSSDMASLMMCQEASGSTYEFIDGEIRFINSRSGRNSEMPAYATQIACLIILAQSLQLPVESVGVSQMSSRSPSHSRAIKIVYRAYERNGWILPSTFDLNHETN